MINIIQWIWAIYLVVKGAYTFAIFQVIILTIIHLLYYVVVHWIFKRGQNYKDKTIIIYWLCCLKFTDPYDLELAQLKKKKKE